MSTRRRRREDDDAVDTDEEEELKDTLKHRRVGVPCFLFTLLAAVILAVILWGLLTGIPAPQRTSLQSVETQAVLGSGVWTDVFYTNTLQSGQRRYTAAASQQATFTAPVSGTYYVDVALGVVYVLDNTPVGAQAACSTISGTCIETSDCCGAHTEALCVAEEIQCQACPAAAASCTNDTDCCQNGLSPNSSICINSVCSPCQGIGGECAGLDSLCCGAPNLACNGTRCYSTVTEAPTSQPTQTPTNQPTASPTTEPTIAPTNTPTTAPTAGPTSQPTTSPTGAPTNTPTEAPTRSPTASPTDAPSSAPTEAPTAQPTPAPTSAPTAESSCVNMTVQAQVVWRRGSVGSFDVLAPLSLTPLQDNFLHATLQITAQAGDVFKVQWASVCPLLALSVQPFHHPQLGVAMQREPLANVSAVIVVRS